MKYTATVTKDVNGRLTSVRVLKGNQKTGLEIDYVYGADGFIRDYIFKARKKDMPNIAEIIDLVNESFIERIGTIKNIDNIEFARVNVLESISSVPNLTVIGTEGIAFKQKAGAGAAWVKPTGFSDPDGKWNNEASAYDSSDSTSADTDEIEAKSWGSFLELTIASTRCNKIKFRLQMGYQGSGHFVDVDVLKDGEWIHVYQGEADSATDIEQSFAEGLITKTRFRFYNTYFVRQVFYVYEVSLGKVATSGGEIHVLLYLYDDSTTSWIPAACDPDGYLETKVIA